MSQIHDSKSLGASKVILKDAHEIFAWGILNHVGHIPLYYLQLWLLVFINKHLHIGTKH